MQPTPEILADFIAESEVATQLQTTVRTLRGWRKQRKGPLFIKVGGKILYRRGAILDWLAAVEARSVGAPQ